MEITFCFYELSHIPVKFYNWLLVFLEKAQTTSTKQNFIIRYQYFSVLLHFRTPPIVIDDSSWKNVAESFTVALTLTLGGYESAIAPIFLIGIFLFPYDVVVS